MSETIEVKYCPACEETKPVAEFYYDSWVERPMGYCKSCDKIKKKNYYKNNKKARKDCMKAYYADNQDKRSMHVKNTYHLLRYTAMIVLSDPVVCAYCDNIDMDVLTIDHIHGGGTKEIRMMGGSQIHRKILKMNPDEARKEYQVLCRNCNWKKWVKDNKKEG